MIEQGKVQRSSRHRYSLAANGGQGKGPSGALSGVYSMSGTGIGFAKDANGQEYFIPERFRGWALPGDSVELKLVKEDPRRSMGRGGSLWQRQQA